MAIIKKQIVAGHIENNAIVLDDSVDLPNGTKVTVIIGDGVEASGLCGIWQDDRAADEIAQEIISARSEGRELPQV